MATQALRACDWCHAKKIKCDRNEPCAACRDNSVACTRDRPRPPRNISTAAAQPNNDRFDVMMRRLSYLENALASQNQERPREVAQSTAEAQPPAEPYPPGIPSPTETRVSNATQPGRQETQPSSGSNSNCSQKPAKGKRRRVSVAASFVSSSKSCHDDNFSPAGQSPLLRQAQRYLAGELRGPKSTMNQERHHLFHSGLALAESVDSEAASSASGSIELENPVDFYADSMYPPAEFLYFILNVSNTGSVITPYYLYLGSHLSKQSLERMQLALMENSVHGNRRLEYIVCVNFWAYLALTALEAEDPSTQMAFHLGGTRDRYLSNAKQALQHLSVMATPTISTIQALLSGVMLFLDAGDFEKCWILNSAACRACVALGKQFLVERAADPESQQAQEIRATVFYCYIFDKSFSINIDRPCSLPDMELSIANPAAGSGNQVALEVCTVLIKIGQVMDILIKERKSSCEGDGAAKKVRRLRESLDSLDSVQELVDRPPESTGPSDNFLNGEWMAMQFTFHSLRAALLDLMLSTEPDPETHQLRLASARRALTALKAMQDNAWAQFIRSKAFASSLTWTILIFPFIAFFIVFSNVVMTADLADLRLLRDVADGFSVVSIDSPTICGIENFCKRLVRLCFETITRPRPKSNFGSTSSLVSRTGVDGSSLQSERNQTQNISDAREFGEFTAEAQSSASNIISRGQSGTRTDKSAQALIPNAEGLGMFEDAIGHLAGWENDEQIWRLLETHFDDFPNGP